MRLYTHSSKALPSYLCSGMCPAEQLSVEVCASGSSLQSRCEGRWGMGYGKAGDRANIQFHQPHGLIWCHAKVWFLLMPAKVLLGGCGFYCQMDEDGSTSGSGQLPGLSSSSLRSMHIHPQAAACASKCHFSLWLHVPVPYRCGEGSAVKLLALRKWFLSCKKKVKIGRKSVLVLGFQKSATQSWNHLLHTSPVEEPHLQSAWLRWYQAKTRGHPQCKMHVLAVRSSWTWSCPIPALLRACLQSALSQGSRVTENGPPNPSSGHTGILLLSTWLMATPVGWMREWPVEVSQLQVTKASPPAAYTV